MDDLIKSMKAHLYDRVSSPLMFSFLCSWAIWNYRLLIIVLSGADPEKKFTQIEALPGKSYINHFVTDVSPELYWLSIGFLGPLITTLFYLLILPWFEAKALEISLEKSVKLKGIKLRAENATPLAHDESIYLRDKIREAEEARDIAVEKQRLSMQKELDKKHKEFEDSQNAIVANHHEAVTKETTLQNQISTLKQDKENLAHQLKEAEALTTVAFGLDEGAREMMKTFYAGRVVTLKQLVQEDPDNERWFIQLYAGGLATVYTGVPRLTHPAERLIQTQLLSQAEQPSLDIERLINQ